jgi:ABC-type Fe3+ transport system substrate-binding protein
MSETLRTTACRLFRLLIRKETLLLASLAAVLAGPFLLQARDTTAPVRYDRRLVILSPHTERIRKEIGRAFALAWKRRTGETLYLDWRTPGGSSEIALFLKSEFASAFQYHWEHVLGKTWGPAVAEAYANPKAEPGTVARRTFLESSVGIGVDLLFGGGSYDFQQFADGGYLVAGDPGHQTGPASLIRRHPDWFNDAVIPERVGGEPFRDREARWVGVVLASFGIVYNRDVLQRLGVRPELSGWQDLANPNLIRQVALSDPTKSGSVAKAFELIVQEQMHRAVAQSTASATQGVREGWEEGLRLIRRIAGNARYFTDSASKIPLEVSRGDAGAGMAIDAYGRATAEFVRRPDGTSRVGFVAPRSGTSLSVDAIGLLRGAPDPELATAFIEFVLSMPGQQLWAYRAGVPGGPVDHALRRLPVRKDFYTEERRSLMADPDEQPYADAGRLDYRPDWTGPLFGVLRFLIRTMCVDTHEELKDAWQTLKRREFPPDALAVFDDVSGVTYDVARDQIAAVLRAKDRLQEVRLARELSDRFRQQYRSAARIAEQGRLP